MNDYQGMIDSAPEVVVEFYATWCGHCQHMMPIVEQIRELIGDDVPIYQLDVDKYQKLCEELDIQGTPTFIIYRNGIEAWKFAGEIDGKVLLNKIQEFRN